MRAKIEWKRVHYGCWETPGCWIKGRDMYLVDETPQHPGIERVTIRDITTNASSRYYRIVRDDVRGSEQYRTLQAALRAQRGNQ